MTKVFLTAIIVGGATVLGGFIGFLLKRIPEKCSELLLCLASGIMLAAAVFGLVQPSVEQGGGINASVGILLGVLFIGVCEKLVPNLHFVEESRSGELKGVVMFVFAIAIHNMPEGVAAGVSLCSGDLATAISVAGGIAIQNIPEGLVVVPPMLSVGVKPIKAFFVVLLTGAVEIIGTHLGYFAASLFTSLLPFFLAFAGGAMLCVLFDEMIPRGSKQGRLGIYVMSVGFIFMTVVDEIL